MAFWNSREVRELNKSRRNTNSVLRIHRKIERLVDDLARDEDQLEELGVDIPKLYRNYGLTDWLKAPSYDAEGETNGVGAASDVDSAPLMRPAVWFKHPTLNRIAERTFDEMQESLEEGLPAARLADKLNRILAPYREAMTAAPGWRTFQQTLNVQLGDVGVCLNDSLTATLCAPTASGAISRENWFSNDELNQSAEEILAWVDLARESDLSQKDLREGLDDQLAPVRDDMLALGRRAGAFRLALNRDLKPEGIEVDNYLNVRVVKEAATPAKPEAAPAKVSASTDPRLIEDFGGWKYRQYADNSIEILAAPASNKSAIGKKLTSGKAYNAIIARYGNHQAYRASTAAPALAAAGVGALMGGPIGALVGFVAASLAEDSLNANATLDSTQSLSSNPSYWS